MTVPIYSMADTWNAGATTFQSILMNVTNGAAGNPVGAAASELISLQTNATERFGVRCPHFSLGTDATPFLNLSDIWNTSATITGLKYNVTDTASNAASLLVDVQVGSSSKASINKTGQIRSLSYATTSSSVISIGFFNANEVAIGDNNGAFAIGVTNDVYLRRDAAATLALRNLANAQTFRIYNTFTDASNYERLSIDWSTTSNVASILTLKAGTGTQRALNFGASGAANWQITTSGHFFAVTNNTYDIGDVAGTGRPRNLYVAGTATIGGSVTGSTFTATGANSFQATAAGNIFWQTRTVMSAPADGLLLIQNQAGTDFSLLQFGGTTTSFPALKRSTVNLQARLADDSGFTGIQGKLTTDANAVTGLTPGALAALTTATIVIYDATGTAYRVPCVTP